MKRLYYVVVALVAILLVYNPVNSLLAIYLHKALPHSIILLSLALVIAAIYRYMRDGYKAFLSAPPEIKLAAAMLLWCLVAFGYGYASKGEAIRGINVDFGGLFAFLAIWLVVPGALAARRLMQIMIGALGLIVVFAIPDVINARAFETWANYLPIHYVVNVIPQVRSITTGPNPLGTLMTLASFLIVLVFANPWVTGLGVAVAGLLMGLTYARSAWVGAAISAGGYFIYTWFRSKKVVIWPMVLATCILVGASWGALRFHEGVGGVLVHGASTEEHGQAVTQVAHNTRKEPWRDKVLGYGPGMAGPIVLTSPSTLKEIHDRFPYLRPISESWYVQVWQELGIVGLVLYLWLYAELTVELFKANKLVGFLAIGLAVNAITLETWAADANLNLMFWTLAALILYAKRPKTAQ